MECVNKGIAGRTIKEYKEDNKEEISKWGKGYYIKNKEEINKKEKRYREGNK